MMLWPPMTTAPASWARSAPPCRISSRTSRSSVPFGNPTMFSAVLRLGAHGVDVAQRVGRRDLAEHVRVVDDRREEIDRVDDRQVAPQAEHSRIVGRFRADNHIGVALTRGGCAARAPGRLGRAWPLNRPP